MTPKQGLDWGSGGGEAGAFSHGFSAVRIDIIKQTWHSRSPNGMFTAFSLRC